MTEKKFEFLAMSNEWRSLNDEQKALNNRMIMTADNYLDLLQLSEILESRNPSTIKKSVDIYTVKQPQLNVLPEDIQEWLHKVFFVSRAYAVNPDEPNDLISIFMFNGKIFAMIHLPADPKTDNDGNIKYHSTIYVSEYEEFQEKMAESLLFMMSCFADLAPNSHLTKNVIHDTTDDSVIRELCDLLATEDPNLIKKQVTFAPVEPKSYYRIPSNVKNWVQLVYYRINKKLLDTDPDGKHMVLMLFFKGKAFGAFFMMPEDDKDTFNVISGTLYPGKNKTYAKELSERVRYLLSIMGDLDDEFDK